MRLVILLAVGAVGLVIWFVQGDPEAERARLQLELRETRSVVGVRGMLAGSEHAFANVAIGAISPAGTVDFRALVLGNEGRRPAFGRAEPVCADALEAPQCWRISLLEIDGRTVLPGAAASGDADR